MDGVVVDKKVDEGDMVQPGQVLLTLYDPTKMQLVANVRESLAEQLKVGQNINVFVEALSLRCQGEVSEIVPQAQRASRSFEVKVTGPCPPGVYAGMFGRMRIPLGKKQVLVIPRDAVRSVGQLNMVRVAKDGRLLRRAVQLGQEIDEKVQVLAGLKPGEQVATHYGTATQPAGA
jgi:RND family efflux transporter MFP subunit